MRPLFAAAIVFALVAGPSLGACGDCCPTAPVPVSVSAVASCCGECETTVGRSSAPVSLAAADSTTLPFAAVPVAAAPALPALPASAFRSAASASSASPPLPPPRPLRL